MGALISSKDWSATPLGPVESWSQTLRNTVRLMLANRFPHILWWGPEYIQFYNDAYIPVPGTKHPKALGQPARECWPEIYHIIGPLIDTPFLGGPATWMDDILLELDRHGFLEETHFTIAYSPVPDDTAPRGIGGVLGTIHEITQQVIQERRVAALRDLGARLSEAKTAEDACEDAASVFARHDKDTPFALIYLVSPDGKTARLAAAAGIEAETEMAPAVVSLEDDDGALWPLASAFRTERTQLVGHLASRFGDTSCGPWSDPPDQALVQPIPSNIQHRLAGFLVLGVSSRIALDEAYRTFTELATAQVATSIANARAYEQERKRAEALAEIDRAKTAFFSNVSHEFRTPLTLLLGPLEDALSAPANLPEAGDGRRDQLVLAHRNALRLLKLVNSLLDFSRIEAGRVEAVYRPVDLARFTAELAGSFRSAVERARLALRVDVAPLPEPAYVDRDMWEKIVLNLLSNAFKHTFEGEIAVSLRSAGRTAILEVRDSGVGIPADQLPHVFERFHRVPNTRSRTHEGTGIGLALVQELVRLHGGEVRVTSMEGVGSTFTVQIPLGAAHLPADRITAGRERQSTAIGATPFVEEALRWLPGDTSHAVTAEMPVTGDGGPRGPDTPAARRARVLVADDNADMRAYAEHLLGTRFQVELANDGAKALASIRESPPDLVLTDVMMPGLDGFELLRALRGDPATREIPVILLSARAGEESRVEGLDAGADDYVVKPFSARELLAKVGGALELARVRREAAAATHRSNLQLEALNAELELDLAAMARMQQLSTRLVGAEDISALLHEILAGAIDITRADKGNIQLLEQGKLRIVTQVGFDTPFIEFFERVSERQAACGTALALGERVVVEDVTESPIFVGTPALEVLLAANVRAVQATPLISRAGHVLGMFSTHYSSAPRRPSERELRLLDMLARQAADLIERRQAEERLRAMERMESVGRLAGGVAHEVNNQMTIALGCADFLLRRFDLPAAAMADVANIRQAAERAAAITQQLLAFGRQQLLRRDVVDLNALLGELTPALQRTLGYDVAIELTLATSVCSVVADLRQLQQVIINLALNARDAMPQGGTLRLRTSHTVLSHEAPEIRRLPELKPGPYCVLMVSDTGIGMDRETLSHIFEPFFTTKPFGQGTGLGLASVYGIVKQSDGDIAVESEPGRGTTFTLYFPQGQGAPSKRESAAIDGAPGHEATVLLAEDDEAVRIIIARVLREAGHRVLEASHGQEAIDILSQGGPIDLLIADVAMPGIGGLRVSEQLERLRPGVPTLFVSGYPGPEMIARGLLREGLPFLNKPFSPDALAMWVRQLLEAGARREAGELIS
jgi:signal transduction histidine kinase/DNA-binding response OmpR family regulator